MIANKEIYLRVINNGGCGAQTYQLDEDVTILMNDGNVLLGTIKQIEYKFFSIFNCDKNTITTLKYKDIDKIANTSWLGGEDIRE